MRKATPTEKEQYALNTQPTPLYPLYGFVTVSGVECPVEYPNETDGPRFEVMSPDAMHFTDGGDVFHTLLAEDAQDLRERLSYFSLAACGGC